MRLKVLVTEDAERDLEDIYTYIAEPTAGRRESVLMDSDVP
jgi:plasmid stabilization system protein ParE